MLDINKIPLDDSRVWDMICEGRVKGCFQIESQLGKTWCKKIKPRNIKELSDLIAIVRPGCVSGDTMISIRKDNSKSRAKFKNSSRYIKVSMRELYENRNKDIYSYITSYSEQEKKFVQNKVDSIIYTGKKECYKIQIRKYSKGLRNSGRKTTWYNLECTLDHKLLTINGWTELKDLKIGDRIAVWKFVRSNKSIKEQVVSRHVKDVKVKNARGMKYFSEICYKHYEEKCVICEWNKSTLDTHHINGNRHEDNSPENLCFLCPNCHREYENGLINKKELLIQRDLYKLPISKDIEWVTYLGYESVGEKDTYDITMQYPHHNFIAGNFVVHNCLQFIFDGKSMAQHYADRKNGIDTPKPLDDSLVEILKSTQQIIIYQEQIINIARKIAGFNDGESRALQKSIGKKDAELLFSLEEKFIQGCKNVGMVTEEKARFIFDNIKKSARYLFNLSHSVQYAHITYWSAYLKYHFPQKFYLHKLSLARDKIDPQQEINELIMSAKSDGIQVCSPSLKLMNENFVIDNNVIYYGFCNVKNVGQVEFNKIKNKLTKICTDWYKLVIDYLLDFNKRTIDNLVYVGTFSIFNKTRLSMLHDLSCLRDLSPKELDWMKINYNGDILESLRKLSVPRSEGGGATNKNRVKLILDVLNRIENPGRLLWDNPSVLAKAERELLGCEISFSEIENCKDASYANCTCNDFNNRNNPKQVVLAATIKDYREIETKNKEKMCFLTIYDDTGELQNIVVFPNVYSDFEDIIYQGSTVLITGKRGDKNDDSFIVDRMDMI